MQEKLDDALKTTAKLRAKLDKSTPHGPLYVAPDVTKGIEKLHETHFFKAKDETVITSEELAYSRSENSKPKVKIVNSNKRKRFCMYSRVN